jgi:UDP-hydrolysing UDP-N-acetyl-D-glucosamine 2-epimerase
MRTIGVVSVARSDYGIYLPILRAIQADPELQLHLILAGMHLSPEFGMTANTVVSDGFAIADRVEMLVSSDSPEGVAKSMGLGTIGFAQSFARYSPDILVILGDRFEMHAAAVAAVPFKLPMAHIHGGESTEGLIDEAMRHSMTKMSHLHFASTQFYADRIVQMGEEPWRVTVSGAPSLDNLNAFTPLPAKEVDAKYGIDSSSPLLVVTYHPVTLEYEDTDRQMEELLGALDTVGIPVVFTYPNSDTYGRRVIDHIDRFTKSHPNSRAVTNLGTRDYFTLMSRATAMVGNSSSGIIEAASFKLPVVNIGNRQRGRVHASNVIDTGYSRSEIQKAITEATSPEFKAGLDGLTNPYGDGHATERIIHQLKTVAIDERLLLKAFFQVGAAPA